MEHEERERKTVEGILMSDQEDPMRTTIKPVHQWTTPDGENPRRRKIERWLFLAMFAWLFVMFMCNVLATPINSQVMGFVIYKVSPIVAGILAGVAALCYPSSHRFLKWLAATILLAAARVGLMCYFDSLMHGWKSIEDFKRVTIFWLDAVLAVLSIIYLAVPHQAWEWLGDGAKQLWKKLRHGRST